MLRFLLAFLLAAPLAFGQVEIEPFIDTSGAVITPGTAGVIPAWNGVPDDLIDTTLSYDGTDITLASGQLLLPDGSTAAPSLTFTSNVDAGIFLNASFVVITSDLTAHLAVGVGQVQLLTGGTAAAPSFIPKSQDSDTGFYDTAANHLGLSMGGALVMDWEDTNAVGEGADLTTISSQLGIMNGSDIFRAFVIDVESADHTGGANSNTLIGLDIDGIVGDADAKEQAIRIGSGWDTELLFTDVTSTIAFNNNGNLTIRDESGFNTLTFRATGPNVDKFTFFNSLAAMNGSDTQRIIYINTTNSNHTGTGNTLNLIDTDPIVGDVNSNLNAINIGALTGTTGAAGEYEAAMRIETGWDALLLMEVSGSAPSENPPAGFASLILDDNADYSGGGGNDCALIGRNAAGLNTVIAILTTDGGC